MSRDEVHKEDRWADWLTKGRQRGLDEKHVRQLNRRLQRLGERVLKDARLRVGERVLDLGAGTGLFALEARKGVKDTGLVVACDISHDALLHCRDAALDEPGVGRLSLAAGDALVLPFPDHTFDVALTRSVLIYLNDKQAGVRELYRVLKPAGRVSIFEPINDVWRVAAERLRETGYFDSFQPAYDRLHDYYRTNESSTFLG
jgi:ubiquinone/menaquinone biosynthesis C-methylase UbiE